MYGWKEWSVVTEKVVQRRLAAGRSADWIDLIEENKDAMEVDQSVQVEQETIQLVEAFLVGENDDRVFIVRGRRFKGMGQRR